MIKIALKNVSLLNNVRTLLKKNYPFIIFLSTTIGFHAREIFLGEFYLYSDRLPLLGYFFNIFKSPCPWSTFQWTENLHFGFSWIRAGGGLFFHFPDFLLISFLNPFQTVLISTLFWFLIAQTFTYLFLRLFNVSRPAAIIGAIMFCFSGSIIRQYVHYTFLIVMLTTPLLFWLVESLSRQFSMSLILPTILVLGNNLLSPHMQCSVYQISIISFYFGFRTFQLYGIKKLVLRGIIFSLIILFAVILSTPYLLPFYDQISSSVSLSGRKDHLSIIGDALGGSRYSRLFLLLHSFLAPKAVGSDVPHANIPSLVKHSWVWCVYIGILPWFCVSGLWRLRHCKELLSFIIICILALLFFIPNLLVPIVPDFRTIYTYIPIWNMFHFYERFLFLGVFSLCILLSISIDSWSQRPGRYGMVIPILLLVMLGELSIIISIWATIPDWLPMQMRTALNNLSAKSVGNYILHTKLGSFMSVFVILSFILVAIRVWLRLSPLIFLWFALIIAVSDLFLFGLPLKPTLNVHRFLFPPPKLAQLIPHGERFITVTSRDSWVWDSSLHPYEARRSLGANLNLFFELSEVGGYTIPVLSKNEYELFNLMLADVPLQGPWHRRKILNPNQIIKVLELWKLYSIQYLVTDMEVKHSEFMNIAKNGEYRLYKITNSLPQIFFASKIQVVKDWNILINKLIETKVIKPIAYVMPDQHIDQNLCPGESIITSINKRNSTNIDIKVQVKKGKTILVMTDRWTKEWKATINGYPVTVYKVNGMQRGIIVPEGNHTIKFYYYDRHLIIGLWLAGFILLFIGGYYLWLIRNKFVNK